MDGLVGFLDGFFGVLGLSGFFVLLWGFLFGVWGFFILFCFFWFLGFVFFFSYFFLFSWFYHSLAGSFVGFHPTPLFLLTTTGE